MALGRRVFRTRCPVVLFVGSWISFTPCRGHVWNAIMNYRKWGLADGERLGECSLVAGGMGVPIGAHMSLGPVPSL